VSEVGKISIPGKIFLDTNILVYAHDLDAGEKYYRAREVVTGLWESGEGVLSVQVLEEFYVNVTKKIPNPLGKSEARDIIRQYMAWEPVAIEGDLILDASDIEERYKLSFWDALIIAAAKAGGASVILTEDITHDQVIEGIRIQNPLR
jgi:predicted nucleic acid-binding protein